MIESRDQIISRGLNASILTCTRRASATNEPNEKLLARKSFLAKTNTARSLSLLPNLGATILFPKRKPRPRAFLKSKDFDFVVALLDSSYARGKES